MSVNVDYTNPTSWDDYYQASCSDCGWHGPERHVSDYLDPADDLGERFADTFASNDADVHELQGCTVSKTEEGPVREHRAKDRTTNYDAGETITMTNATDTTMFSQETLEADRAVIDAAKQLKGAARVVLPGTPEWAVLQRHVPDLLEFEEQTPERLWGILVAYVHPSNPFRTECPAWCTLEDHDDSIRLHDDKPFTQVTYHEATIASSGRVHVDRERCDELVGGRVVTTDRHVFYAADGVDVTAEELRDLARMATAAAAAIDQVEAESLRGADV